MIYNGHREIGLVLATHFFSEKTSPGHWQLSIYGSGYMDVETPSGRYGLIVWVDDSGADARAELEKMGGRLILAQNTIQAVSHQARDLIAGVEVRSSRLEEVVAALKTEMPEKVTKVEENLGYLFGQVARTEAVDVSR